MAMYPPVSEMQYCIVMDGQIVDGANGLAIGQTEMDAWERAIDPAVDWAIQRAKDGGASVYRCFIGVVNLDA